MTDAPPAMDLSRFLKAVRNRLWLLRCGQQSVRAGALAAGLLLIAGLLHRYLLPLPGWLAPGIAFGLPLIAVVRGLCTGYPDRASAARTADRLFDGKCLLATAEELVRSSGRLTDVEFLIVNRANSAVAQWHPRLAAELPFAWPRPTPYFATLALLGGFLLLLPGARIVTTVASVPAVTSIEPGGTPADGDASAVPGIAGLFPDAHRLSAVMSPDRSGADRRAVPASRASITDMTRGTAGEPAEPSAAPGVRPATSLALAPAVDTDPMRSDPDPRRPPPDRMSAESATGGATGSDTEGRLPGGGAGIGDARPATVDLPAAEYQFRTVVIPRGATSDRPGTGTTDLAAALADTVAAEAVGLPTTRSVPAAEFSAPAYRTDFSPALRRYAARYFTTLGQNDDQ